ncbi:MAG: hypothetical protein ACRCWQ_04765 [Bacilli bacterium]
MEVVVTKMIFALYFMGMFFAIPFLFMYLFHFVYGYIDKDENGSRKSHLNEKLLWGNLYYFCLTGIVSLGLGTGLLSISLILSENAISNVLSVLFFVWVGYLCTTCVMHKCVKNNEKWLAILSWLPILVTIFVVVLLFFF